MSCKKLSNFLRLRVKRSGFCVRCRKIPTLDAGRWTLDAGRWTLDAGRWTLDAGRWTIFGFAHLPSCTASVEPISPRLRVYPQVTRNRHIRYALGAWSTASYE